MIQVLETDKVTNKTNEIGVTTLVDIDFKDKWIHLTNPTDREIELIMRATGAPEDMLKAALDDEERARIESDDGFTLTLFDIPVIEEESTYFSYNTMPLGHVSGNGALITVCLKENSIIHTFMNGRVKNCDISNKARFLFQLLYSSHVKFLQYLRQIDKSSQRIQTELHKSTKNKELIQLLDIKNSLVYFATSLRANNIILDRVSKYIKEINDEDQELLEDAKIENRQALDMCTIYREILSGTAETYATVISNNLNIIMRVLTSLTVLISVPTLVASFWGMNTGVPFQGKQWGFWVVVVFSAIATIVSGYFLKKANDISRKK
ncbi:MAG: magnesium transporter CorA family protein [Christensenellaceae bacterium]|jgi:magnesium transporter|nr:magnesium transporter CorA family protein [Christensenellaceae bacterium]